jgi:hypothetical protein
MYSTENYNINDSLKALATMAQPDENSGESPDDS